MNKKGEVSTSLNVTFGIIMGIIFLFLGYLFISKLIGGLKEQEDDFDKLVDTIKNLKDNEEKTISYTADTNFFVIGFDAKQGAAKFLSNIEKKTSGGIPIVVAIIMVPIENPSDVNLNEVIINLPKKCYGDFQRVDAACICKCSDENCDKNIDKCVILNNIEKIEGENFISTIIQKEIKEDTLKTLFIPQVTNKRDFLLTIRKQEKNIFIS